VAARRRIGSEHQPATVIGEGLGARGALFPSAGIITINHKVKEAAVPKSPALRVGAAVPRCSGGRCASTMTLASATKSAAAPTTSAWPKSGMAGRHGLCIRDDLRRQLIESVDELAQATVVDAVEQEAKPGKLGDIVVLPFRR
jgi:hypothetical protein